MAEAPNPFELYDIDPTKGPEAITERLRELTDATDPEEREVLRAVWERLTMHPRRRLRIALAAFPENVSAQALSDQADPTPAMADAETGRAFITRIVDRVAQYATEMMEGKRNREIPPFFP